MIFSPTLTIKNSPRIASIAHAAPAREALTPLDARGGGFDGLVDTFRKMARTSESVMEDVSATALGSLGEAANAVKPTLRSARLAAKSKLKLLEAQSTTSPFSPLITSTSVPYTPTPSTAASSSSTFRPRRRKGEVRSYEEERAMADAKNQRKREARKRRFESDDPEDQARTLRYKEKKKLSDAVYHREVRAPQTQAKRMSDALAGHISRAEVLPSEKDTSPLALLAEIAQQESLKRGPA